MRRLVPILALLLALPAFAEVPADAEPLILAVAINSVPTNETGVYWMDGDKLVAEAVEWARLGILLSEEEEAKATLSAGELGITYEIEEATQSIQLRVPASRRPHQTIKPDDSPTVPLSLVAPGVLVNYNLAGTASRRFQGVSAGHEIRMGGKWGVVSHAGQANWTSSDRASYVRGDTRYQFDDEKRHISYQAGDVRPTGAPVALAGVRIAKDLQALNPMHPVYPVPKIGGIALETGEVRILANGREVAQHDLEAGPFSIEKVPVPGGRSTTALVVRDKFGREQVIDRGSLYFSPDVLRKGLTTWELAAGKVRTGADTYGEMGATASIERGINDRWTVSSGAQAARQGWNATVGTRFVAGSAGVVSASYSRSSADWGAGSAYSAGYDYQGPVWGVSAQHSRRTPSYFDLGALSPRYTPVLSETDARVRFRSPSGALAGSLGYTDMTTSDDRFRFASANLTYQRGPHSVLAGASYDMQRRAPGFELGYRYQFDQGSLAVSARKAPQITTTRLAGQVVGITKDGDYYQVSGDYQQDNQGNRYGGIRGTKNSQTGTWSGELNYANGEPSLSMGYSGAIHLGKTGTTRLPTVSDGYAVVRIDGVEGIPVKVNNTVVGKTDKNGVLVVGPLPALVGSKISIDDKALPMEVSLERSEMIAAPKRMQAALVEFPVAGRNARTFIVRRGEKEVEVGAEAKSKDAVAMVGYGGELYLETPKPDELITITDKQGVCAIQLPSALPKFEEVATLQCKP